MPEIRDILIPHHKHCDELFSQAEEAAHAADWTRCADLHEQFSRELLAHLAAEEEHLFPAFETATGMTQGPTRVMRMEHEQMRELVVQMNNALVIHDQEAYTGAAETLLILMQQHNMKEENILYPMCDQNLVAQMDSLSAMISTRLAATA